MAAVYHPSHLHHAVPAGGRGQRVEAAEFGDIAMRERPILFSGEIVRAILGGRKTMTRRVIKPQPKRKVHHAVSLHEMIDEVELWQDDGPPLHIFSCPFGQVGDQLWVRENIRPNSRKTCAVYSADGLPVMRDGESVGWIFNEPHVPSIHMPRRFSRITLEITGIRVERLQDITEEDAHDEGMGDDAVSVIYNFHRLWDSLHAKDGYGWEANPFVWVIAFRRKP